MATRPAPSSHVVWAHDLVEGACALSGMTGFDDDWKLLYGESVADDFPGQARFAMNPDTPDDIALTDSLRNIDRLIVASQALRDLIEAQQPDAVEYLPVSILNHKKRLVKAAYFVVHPIHPVDCLDVAACKPTYGRIQKTAIQAVRRLVIDESRIPAGRLLLRPAGFTKVILVHRSLADRIDAAGLTGMRWIELPDYPEA